MIYFRLVTFYVFLIDAVQSQCNYYIEFTKASCTFNSPIIKTLECSLRKDDKNSNLIDGRLELAATIDAIRVRTILQFSRKNMPKMTVYDITLNACEFFETIHKHKIMLIFKNTLSKFVNQLPECPIQKVICECGQETLFQN